MGSRCPCCGQAVRGVERIGPSWQCWPCGDVLTTEQAWPILGRERRPDVTEFRKKPAEAPPMSETTAQPVGRDMGKHGRNVRVDGGLVTGAFWVSRPDESGRTYVSAIEVTVWGDLHRLRGGIIREMIARVEGDAVHLPEHIAGASAGSAVLDRAEAIKAAVLAAARAVDWDHCPGCQKGRGYQQ